MARNRVERGHGPSQRQLRVGEVIRRALSDALLRGETREQELAGASITVSEVRASPDLRVATVFVLPLGGARTAETMAALDRAKGELRRAVTRAAGLRFSPELRFVVDQSFDRMDEMRTLLSGERVRSDTGRDG